MMMLSRYHKESVITCLIPINNKRIFPQFQINLGKILIRLWCDDYTSVCYPARQHFAFQFIVTHILIFPCFIGPCKFCIKAV